MPYIGFVDKKINTLYVTIYSNKNLNISNIRSSLIYSIKKNDLTMDNILSSRTPDPTSPYHFIFDLGGDYIVEIKNIIFRGYPIEGDDYIAKVEMAGILGNDQVYTYPDPIPQIMKLITCYKCNKKRY